MDSKIKLVPLEIEQLENRIGRPVYAQEIDGFVLVSKNSQGVLFTFHNGAQCSAQGWYEHVSPVYEQEYVNEPIVEEFVEYWHTHETNSSLQEFLGMSKQEYEDWVKGSSIKIDREAWKPCKYCEFGIYSDAMFDYEAGHIELAHCPKCGRPITEKAWKQLESRLKVLHEV